MLNSTHLRGVLNVNKPSGISSYDVIRTIKRIFKNEQKSGFVKIGHSGTLDPIADGVLLVLFNEATKIAHFLTELKKEYIAEIKFGIKTNTDDITGKVIKEEDGSKITKNDIEMTLPQFIGEIYQIPPIFSALHEQGRRLYNLARAGQRVQPKMRKVFIYELHLIEFKPPMLVIRAVVGKGAYIRALARDLGDKLGSGATLNRLTRTRVGHWTLEDAVNLNDLTWRKIKEHLCPLAKALPGMKTIYVKDAIISKLLNGQEISCEAEPIKNESLKAKPTPIKILDEAEKVMLIGTYTFGRLKPIRLVYADLPKTK